VLTGVLLKVENGGFSILCMVIVLLLVFRFRHDTINQLLHTFKNLSVVCLFSAECTSKREATSMPVNASANQTLSRQLILSLAKNCRNYFWPRH
jgi:hypothetical protein